MALEAESAYFKRELPELLRHHKDQYAVIKGETLLGAYTTFEEAFTAGVSKWGNASFLIRVVNDEEPVADFPALSVGLISANADP